MNQTARNKTLDIHDRALTGQHAQFQDANRAAKPVLRIIKDRIGRQFSYFPEW